MYNNYSVSEKRGAFYQKSKEPKEGYEEVIYGDNKKTYHFYVNKVSGVLQKIEVVEIPDKKLKFLEITLQDGNDINKISTTPNKANGNFSDAATNLISAFHSAEFGQRVVVSTKKNGEYLNIYVNYVDKVGEDGKGLSAGYIPHTDVPRAIKDEDPDLGVTWDWRPVNKFWAVKLKELLERSSLFSPSDAASSTPPTTGGYSGPSSFPDTKNKTTAFDVDDLPF